MAEKKQDDAATALTLTAEDQRQDLPALQNLQQLLALHELWGIALGLVQRKAQLANQVSYLERRIIDLRTEAERWQERVDLIKEERATLIRQ